MNDKINILIMSLVGVFVLVGVLFYFLGSSTLEFSDVLLIALPILLGIGVMILIWDKIKNVRMGLPSEDERVKKLHWKAGAYSYYATIWIAVGTMWYNILFGDIFGFSKLNVEGVVGVIVLVSGLFFIVLNFYFMRKADCN